MYGRAPRVLAHTGGGGSTGTKIGPGYYSPQEPKHRVGTSSLIILFFAHTVKTRRWIRTIFIAGHKGDVFRYQR